MEELLLNHATSRLEDGLCDGYSFWCFKQCGMACCQHLHNLLLGRTPSVHQWLHHTAAMKISDPIDLTLKNPRRFDSTKTIIVVIKTL